VAFARRFGEVREMGAGKRDREKPHLKPNSAAEVLWYRALLAKAFFDTEQGAQEFAFIPDDLSMALEFAGEALLGPDGEDPVDGLAEEPETQRPSPPAPKAKPAASLVKSPEKRAEKLPPQPAPVALPALAASAAAEKDALPLGRPASPAEKAFPVLASDRLLDDACTLLAALRMGIPPAETGIPAQVVMDFLSAAQIIVAGEVQPEPAKNFLEAPRPKALELVAGAWQDSTSFNELRQLPELVCEGEWKNAPLVTREFLLDLLNQVPENQWWSLPAFVRDLKTRYPDFQRPAGDYDSWFVKRRADGVFLRGFASWEQVDGALVRYFVSGPLFWLGMVDLAAPEPGGLPGAFRAAGNGAPVSNAETGKLNVLSNGQIAVPRLAPRAARYQIARFCEWDGQKGDEYAYRVTPASLAHAREQGLKVEHLLGILRKHAAGPLPPPFVRALQRWEANGVEARVEGVVILKVSKPEVLNELRASKAGRFLGEVLGPVTVVVKSGAEPKVLAALAEMGLLAETSTPGAESGG